MRELVLSLSKSFIAIFKMKYAILYVFLLSMTLLSCTTQQYYVEGKSTVPSMDGKKLYLKVFQEGQLVDVDSSEVVHGMFHFTGIADSTMMVNLFMDDEGLMPFVLESQSELQIHIDKAQQYVTGSALNDSLYSFIQAKSQLDNQMSELPHKESQMIMDGIDEDIIMLRLNDEAKRLTAEQDRLITRFITSNFDNVLGSGVFMILTSSYPYPVMTPQIEEIMMKATPYFKNDAYVRQYIEMARENMRLAGMMADSLQVDE